MGFIFINSYLGIGYFSRDYKSNHVGEVPGVTIAFKIILANQLVTSKDVST